jgi:hypothetical protein
MIERSNIHSWRECETPETNITLDNKYHRKTILTLVIKWFIQDQHTFILLTIPHLIFLGFFSQELTNFFPFHPQFPTNIIY